MSGQYTEAIFLAWRDWKFETLLSLCAVLALASMLSPLLILQGLKNGVTAGMRTRLLQDPTTLIITPKSDAGRFSAEFIAQLAALPGAAYAIGRTRETATDLTLSHGNLQSSIALEPATEGEPVLARHNMPVPKDGASPELILSAPAAQILDVSAGAELLAHIGRRTPEGRLESLPVTFKVAGVLPITAAERRLAFAPAQFLEDMENYRDNIAIPARGIAGTYDPRPREYASFRLYAKSLDDVQKLARNLADQQIEVITRSRDIAAIQSLEASINQIILIITIAVGTGFVAFMLSSAEGAARRKKKMLGMLRLLGFRRLPLMFYPLTQSFLTAVCGFLLSLLIYSGVATVIAHAFIQKGGLSCYLPISEGFYAFAAVLLLSWAATSHAAWHTATLEPSMVIREV